jgi:hypothetical protein
MAAAKKNIKTNTNEEKKTVPVCIVNATRIYDTIPLFLLSFVFFS